MVVVGLNYHVGVEERIVEKLAFAENGVSSFMVWDTNSMMLDDDFTAYWGPVKSGTP